MQKPVRSSERKVVLKVFWVLRKTGGDASRRFHEADPFRDIAEGFGGNRVVDAAEVEKG